MLIAMCTYDTPENGRASMTYRTLISLAHTVDLRKHRIIVVDNASTDPLTVETLNPSTLIGLFGGTLFAREAVQVIRNDRNIGTAAAINRAWKSRKPLEHAVKMDNDVVIAQAGWIDMIEDALDRDPKLGILGLKRKDLEERPDSPVSWYKSSLRMLPHEPGQRWIVVEDVQHVMGTCQAYSAALLAKIGYLYQMQDEGNLYGFDDSLASYRAHLAGFTTAFLCGVEIDHIDPGGTPHTEEKRRMAAHYMARFNAIKDEYDSGVRPLYWEDK